MTKIRHLFFNPFFIFWAYYLVGPFVTSIHILKIAENENLFNESQIIEKFFIHFLAYISLLPFIIIISDLFKEKLINDNVIKVYIKTIPGIKQLVIVLLIVFFGILINFVIENPLIIILPDMKRAGLYIEYLETYHIITLLIILFILIKLFLKEKVFVFFGIMVSIFDILMSRRSLMIFFFYSITKKLTLKLLVFMFMFSSLFMLLRHRDLIFTDGYEFGNIFDPFFGESYMVFLSNVQFQECPITISNVFQYLNFERVFQNSCRYVSNGAGGFSSRFYFNSIFGIISVFVFTIVSSSLLLFLHKFIEKSLLPVLKTLLFVSLFICFRDSLWNSQIFLIKYFFVLMVFSMIIHFMKKLNIFIEYTKVE
jgi:hypothetical protein